MAEASCGHTPYDRDQVPGCIICAQAEIERLKVYIEAYAEEEKATINEVVEANKQLRTALEEAIDWLKDTDTEGTRVRLQRWRKTLEPRDD